MTNNQVKTAVIAAVGVIVLAVVIGFFGNKRAAIEAERAEQIRLIEREDNAIVEAQRTERTEERSQFWQKLVPWGEDETEGNDTDISTEAPALTPTP